MRAAQSARTNAVPSVSAATGCATTSRAYRSRSRGSGCRNRWSGSRTRITAATTASHLIWPVAILDGVIKQKAHRTRLSCKYDSVLANRELRTVRCSLSGVTGCRTASGKSAMLAFFFSGCVSEPRKAELLSSAYVPYPREE